MLITQESNTRSLLFLISSSNIPVAFLNWFSLKFETLPIPRANSESENPVARPSVLTPLRSFPVAATALEPCLPRKLDVPLNALKPRDLASLFNRLPNLLFLFFFLSNSSSLPSSISTLKSSPWLYSSYSCFFSSLYMSSSSSYLCLLLAPPIFFPPPPISRRDSLFKSLLNTLALPIPVVFFLIDIIGTNRSFCILRALALDDGGVPSPYNFKISSPSYSNLRGNVK